MGKGDLYKMLGEVGEFVRTWPPLMNEGRDRKMKSRRKFSSEFKQTAIRQMAGGKSAAEVARALEVHPSDLYRWRRELEEHGVQAFTGAGRKRADDDRVAELERKVGQQTLEIDFLKRALQHVEEQRLLRALSNGAHSTSRSRRK